MPMEEVGLFKKDMVKITLLVIEKQLSQDQLYYSDYMYGCESYTEDVWEYVMECREIGTVAFREKYKKELA